jgi:hypothetical protein
MQPYVVLNGLAEGRIRDEQLIQIRGIGAKPDDDEAIAPQAALLILLSGDG